MEQTEEEAKAWGLFDEATISLGVEHDHAMSAVLTLLRIEREKRVELLAACVELSLYTHEGECTIPRYAMKKFEAAVAKAKAEG